jgi:aminoglycoside phosphotransferase (APT) family kinase protein
MTSERDVDGFPSGALPWIEARTGGKIVALKRLVVRREAWRADIDQGDGTTRPWFLRIDRESAAGKPYSRNLKREAGLIRYLCENTTIPTQKIKAWNDEFCVAIQSFEPGRADLHNAPRAEQHDVMMHFMDIMAEMHRIDVNTLDLEEFELPQTPEDHSLLELRAVEDPRLAKLPIDSSTLLGEFGKRWLLNHVPREVERTVLLQGDTGPGNFMFENHRVTAVVDWEWAHYGDPMEDVGNLWLRDFFTPSCGGDLTPYVRHYAERAGVTLDRAKAIYYLVHQLIRSVITLPGLVRRPDWKTTVALNVGYQAVCDIASCEAIGLYHDIAEESCELLEIAPRDEAGELFQVLAKQIEKGMLPDLQNDFTRSTARGAVDLTRYLERRYLYGPQADALELAGINDILGVRHHGLAEARSALHEALQHLQLADEPRVLRHCWAVARRNMQLTGPLVDRWSYCKLPRLD